MSENMDCAECAKEHEWNTRKETLENIEYEIRDTLRHFELIGKSTDFLEGLKTALEMIHSQLVEATA